MSRLKGVASRCNFEMKCSCGITNSFKEAITRFKLIAGLVDTEIKEDILSMSDMNLEEIVKAVEGKESGKVARLKVGVQDAKVLLETKIQASDMRLHIIFVVYQSQVDVFEI